MASISMTTMSAPTVPIGTRAPLTLPPAEHPRAPVLGVVRASAMPLPLHRAPHLAQAARRRHEGRVPLARHLHTTRRSSRGHPMPAAMGGPASRNFVAPAGGSHTQGDRHGQSLGGGRATALPRIHEGSGRSADTATAEPAQPTAHTGAQARVHPSPTLLSVGSSLYWHLLRQPAFRRMDRRDRTPAGPSLLGPRRSEPGPPVPPACATVLGPTLRTLIGRMTRLPAGVGAMQPASQLLRGAGSLAGCLYVHGRFTNLRSHGARAIL